MDFSAIGAIVSSLNAAANIVKTGFELGKDSAVTSRTMELQLILVGVIKQMSEIQTQALAMQRRFDDLEKENLRLQEFEMNKDQYQLQQPGPGAFVYVLKCGPDTTDPVHWLCAHCADEKVHSIIQFAKSTRDGRVHVCPRCKGEIVVAHDPSEGSIQIVPRNRDGAW